MNVKYAALSFYCYRMPLSTKVFSVCGIIGYIGDSEAAPILLEGLKKLEYRGYDSVGIATIHENEIIVKKDVGKVDEVASKFNFLDTPGNIGIGHTRWATHGKVCRENAHPHLSCDGSIAVVHNGIIENYLELRAFLEKKGIKFESETDTEVIPNLILYWIREGLTFENAVTKALQCLKGSYALLIIKKDEPKMIIAKNESPLVIGIGENGFYAASDIPALLKFTRKVMYLRDGDVAFITPTSLKVVNLMTGKTEDKKIYEISYETRDVEKGEFQHYMLKEILEQSNLLEKLAKSNFEEARKAVSLLHDANRIWITGAGTSYHACIAGKYMFARLASLPIESILASEFENFYNLVKAGDVVLAVSQSGETADVLRVVKEVKRKNVKVVSLVNILGSSLSRMSDVVVPLNAGIEIGVAATKTYTAELVNLAFLAYSLGNKVDEFKEEMNFVSNVIYNLTAETTRKIIEDLAKMLKNKEHIFLIGRGLEYATALEAALKIKEISYIHAEAFAGGELKHGTIALIEKDTPVIVFVSRKSDTVISNAEEIKSRGGLIIGVSPKHYPIFDRWIKTPEDDVLNPVIQIVPMQLLAYQLAVLRGYDPDKPRNLAKSVTVI